MLPPPTRGQVRERQCLLPARWGTGAWGRWLELIPRGSGCKVLGEPQGRGLRASPPAQPLVGGAWASGHPKPTLWPLRPGPAPRRTLTSQGNVGLGAPGAVPRGGRGRRGPEEPQLSALKPRPWAPCWGLDVTEPGTAAGRPFVCPGESPGAASGSLGPGGMRGGLHPLSLLPLSPSTSQARLSPSPPRGWYLQGSRRRT